MADFRGSSSGIQRRIQPVMDIIIKGGAVADIVDIPDGVIVRVWDHDIQGGTVEESELKTSPYGDGQATVDYWS